MKIVGWMVGAVAALGVGAAGLMLTAAPRGSRFVKAGFLRPHPDVEKQQAPGVAFLRLMDIAKNLGGDTFVRIDDVQAMNGAPIRAKDGLGPVLMFRGVLAGYGPVVFEARQAFRFMPPFG